MLAAQEMRVACLRAAFSDGSRMLISSAMMPITTSSSTSVKPGRRRGGGRWLVRDPS
jgi:hypothetical protein